MGDFEDIKKSSESFDDLVKSDFEIITVQKIGEKDCYSITLKK